MVLALVLLDATASAEPPSSGSDRIAGAESAPDERSPTTIAKIVLIGKAAADPELPLLFAELLERQGVAVEIERAERFEPGELFGSEDDGMIRAFVLLGDSNRARLRFRGPNGERYLLRQVTLSGGLDAVGRELLGQVVESSIVALLRSTEGLSRKEVVAALEGDDRISEAERPPAPPRPTPAPEKRVSPRRAPSPWELRLGARYAASWSGPELGASHGPGLSAGARFRQGPSFGFELGADRRFQQSLSTPELRATLERTAFNALLEAGLSLTPSQSAFVALGGGLSLTRTRPRSNAPGVAAAPEKSALEPALRAELRYELGAGSLLLGFAALLEGTLTKMRYELVHAGRPELLAAPPPFQPGAVVTVGVRP
jgi:hypothetical protein